MRVSLFADFKEENWPSMERYASGLSTALAAGYPDDSFSVLRPKYWDVLDRFKPIFKKIPYLRFWGNDLFLNRYLNYPLFAIFNHSNLNHILDHSYLHLLSYLPKERTVVTCHDLIPLKLHNPDLTKDKYLRLFEKTVKSMVKAQFVLADSYATKNDLIEFLAIPADKIEVVYPGLKKKFSQSMDQETLMVKASELGFSKDWQYLLHVGVSQPYKNVEMVIKALKILVDAGLKIKLIKAGQDFTFSQKQLIQDLGLDDFVMLFIKPSDGDLNIIYQSSSVLVYPSLVEGFGWPVLESLSCGLPVVCSDWGSLGEIGGSEVFFCDPLDPNDIAKEINEVFNLRQASEFKVKQNKWQKWVEQFNWEKAASKTYQVYERILNHQ